MPALRVGERQEGRLLEENGPNRQGTQRLREEIRAAGGNGFRLAEDAAVRMDRIFGPPIPIPFGGNGVIGQQERRFRKPDGARERIRRCLSGFVGSHRGFSRGGLRDWLNLFYFCRNTPGDAFQKAQAFIELAVKKRKILRYRSWGKAKNSDKS